MPTAIGPEETTKVFPVLEAFGNDEQELAQEIMESDKHTLYRRGLLLFFHQ